MVSLPLDEALHATRVLRLTPGDSIRVFDGGGGEWRAEIAHVKRQQVEVVLREAVAAAREPRIPLVLAPAVLKGEKMDDLVRDAVMLGATAVQPLVTDRTEISIAALARSTRIERWQRIAIASCKQSGRAVVPAIRSPLTFEAWLAEQNSSFRLVLVEPAATADSRAVHDVSEPVSAEMAVGPEGGWTARELAVAESTGVQFVTLGALTLRADAAPIVALTALRTVWRDL
jgi:16S rRNA (uracil1498-N3)-methyltransferase